MVASNKSFEIIKWCIKINFKNANNNKKKKLYVTTIENLFQQNLKTVKTISFESKSIFLLYKSLEIKYQYKLYLNKIKYV